jgi:hypothetical protein
LRDRDPAPPRLASQSVRDAIGQADGGASHTCIIAYIVRCCDRVFPHQARF